MRDKQLMVAFSYIVEEVVRIMLKAIKDGKLTRREWDTVNKLLEVFSDDIKKLNEWEE